MEQTLNSNPKSDVLTSASHDHKPMLSAVNIELLFELICAKNNGISKCKIVEKLTQFGVSNSRIDMIFRRIHYARSSGGSFSAVLLQRKKWYTFDNKERCSEILRYLLETRIKPTEKPFEIPYWVFERWELSKAVLVESI